ncbi:MAG: OsmC family peroxiredoxin [Bacteroidota bacterium]|nr:OsmC family peroxiredoxin [Bacteroidota bacterium]MDE2832976.1 OsmC family peroxiredoxin [Bacteroidota bacterium]
MIVRHADAVWEGDLKSGRGHMKEHQGGFETEFTFASRTEDGGLTSPEDLVAAAQASCYAMALSNELASNGNVADRVEAHATVNFGPDPAGGFHISEINLVVRAAVPGISEEAFQQAAEATRVGCPISKLFTGTTITLDAQLTGQ